MGMGWSWKIGRLFGIRIKLHFLFLVILALEVLRPLFSFPSGHKVSGALEVLSYFALLFGIILLHEFGHCWAGRAVGGDANEVILWPLGGLALVGSPNRPGARLLTAAGGPLVNVAIAALLLPFMVFTGELSNTSLYPPDARGWLGIVFLLNLFLLGFNLLPCFPLDGGRIFRALLWYRLGFRQATIIAVRTGMVISVLLGIVGFLENRVLLVFIAVFAFMACRQEQRLVQLRGSLEPWATGGEDWKAAASRPPRQSWRARRKERRRKREERRHREEEQRLRERVDRILDKINREGMQSLTPEEKKLLDEASERLR